MARLLAPQQALRLRASSKTCRSCAFAFTGLPRFIGSPIHVSLKPQLTTFRGKLLSRSPDKGTAVFAATFIRRRTVVLDAELCAKPELMRHILLHELFHFSWVRLGNPGRHSYASLILKERIARARGEVGESAQVSKNVLRMSGEQQARLWRNYVCESFCDTAAWICCAAPPNQDCTLAERYRERRKAWFRTFLNCEIRC